MLEERMDPGGNPACAIGLRSCKFYERVPKSKSSNISRISMSSYNTTSSGADFEHARRNREILKTMTRHDRSSLSKEWSNDRSMTVLYLPRMYPSSSGRIEQIRALRPITKDHHHQDSLFGNSFQSKSFFIVHPEWISETVDNTDPEPLHRPPWPWEQPRYRQNIQIPITYKVDETEEEMKKTENQQNSEDNSDMPMVMDAPMCLPIGYTFTHPGIDLTKPYEKQTQFGAPLVDTSVYKLSY